DAGHLKEGGPQGLAQGGHRLEEVEGDGGGGDGDDAQEAADLLGAQGVLDAAHQDQVVDVEVDAEEDHKDAQQHLHIGAAVARDAGGGHGEAAGTGRAEGQTQAVVELDAAGQQQNHQDGGHDGVDPVEDHGGALHPGHQLSGDG